MGRGQVFANRGQIATDLRTADKEIMGLFDSLSGERLVELAALVISDDVQVRVGGLDTENLARLQAVMENGGELPPIVVYETEQGLIVADGFHRAEIARRLGMTQIMAEVRKGSYEDALNFAEDANLKHGKMLSLADKKNLLYRRLARGHEWASTSNRAIAKALGVDDKSIGNWLNAHRMSAENSALERRQVRGSDGRVYDISKIKEASQQRAKPSGANAPVIPLTKGEIKIETPAQKERHLTHLIQQLEDVDGLLHLAMVKPKEQRNEQYIADLQTRKADLERRKAIVEAVRFDETPPRAPSTIGPVEMGMETDYTASPYEQIMALIGKMESAREDMLDVLADSGKAMSADEAMSIVTAFRQHVTASGELRLQMKEVWGVM